MQLHPSLPSGRTALPWAPFGRHCLTITTLLCLLPALHAQGPAFQSPGTPTRSTLGQTTQFTTDFNPAIGAVIDTYADYTDAGEEDGFNGELRLFELNLASYIDPHAWAYAVLVSENGESPTVEEVAVEYTGLSGNQSLKVGRFFADFGKQMQQHAEELRTLERPLPLREYLGAELGGVGLQYDNWFAAGDSTPVRFSLGMFSSLASEGHHEHEEEGEEPEVAGHSYKDFDDFTFTARLTGMTDVGETGLLQLGASARLLPNFALEYHPDELEAPGLSNSVVGLDATFSRSDVTGLKTLLLGGEYLIFDGDLAGELDDPAAPTDIQITEGKAEGFFLFGDYSWDLSNSIGVQYAVASHAEDPATDTTELDLYWTRHLTEYRRLRLGATFADEAGEDSNRIYLQFTNYFGNHSHGLAW
ncbi:MAG: hypothetical protein QF599_08290 [Planctomycetota bacterium]|nr:hypothetical protein [Planctomycetota bacterium]MDP6955962.1 hypothetical protein [Planctomycetota bacterium]